MQKMASVVIALAIGGCGKSGGKTETKAAGSATPGSAAPTAPSAGSGSGSAPSEPAEAAEVVGPTKSATGTLEVTGAVAGTFEWKKKDQRAPITCIWDPEKEIGTLKIDVSDGAGKLLTLGLDIPPTDVGPGRLEVSGKDLPSSLKTYSGFKLKGDAPDTFKAVFDGTVVVTDPDAQAKAQGDKKKKKAEPPPDPHLTIKGELEVTCPKKK